MKKYILFSLIAFAAYSCGGRYTYPQDKGLSTNTGALADSTASYLPTETKYDGITYRFDWDTDRLAAINSFYKLTSEPLLYNYYQEASIYRLLLAKKNEDPLIITINKKEEENWVVSKKIDLKALEINENIADTIAHVNEVRIDFKNYSRALTESEVHAFDSIFQQVDFFCLENVVSAKHDSYIVLEGHEKNNYWYIYRSAEDQVLKNIVDFMRSLTGF